MGAEAAAVKKAAEEKAAAEAADARKAAEDSVVVAEKMPAHDASEAPSKAAEKASPAAEAEDKPKDAQEQASPSTEKRVDPSDGCGYTFGHIAELYQGKYPKRQIQSYWEKDCKP